jgi:hypothetical protein
MVTLDFIMKLSVFSNQKSSQNYHLHMVGISGILLLWEVGWNLDLE